MNMKEIETEDTRSCFTNILPATSCYKTILPATCTAVLSVIPSIGSIGASWGLYWMNSWPLLDTNALIRSSWCLNNAPQVCVFYIEMLLSFKTVIFKLLQTYVDIVPSLIRKQHNFVMNFIKIHSLELIIDFVSVVCGILSVLCAVPGSWGEHMHPHLEDIKDKWSKPMLIMS